MSWEHVKWDNMLVIFFRYFLHDCVLKYYVVICNVVAVIWNFCLKIFIVYNKIFKNT